MKISLSGIVTEKYESEKGNTYLSMVDIVTGGILKLTYFQSTIDAKSGDQLTGEIDIKPSNGKYGQQLTVVGGSFKKGG